MCIAVVKPEGVRIRKKVLQACFARNPDGIGYAVPSYEGVEVFKGFFRFREFWHSFREHQDLGLPMLIHFRVATSGEIDEFNCHPWEINQKHALIHNGVLEHRLGLKNDQISDTGLFTEHIVRPIFEKSDTLWKTPAFRWTMEESIGTGNKVAILDNKGHFEIFNDKQGEWFEGSWFSNKTYKEERKKRSYTVTHPPAAYGYGTINQNQLLLLEDKPVGCSVEPGRVDISRHF